MHVELATSGLAFFGIWILGLVVAAAAVVGIFKSWSVVDLQYCVSFNGKQLWEKKVVNIIHYSKEGCLFWTLKIITK